MNAHRRTAVLIAALLTAVLAVVSACDSSSSSNGSSTSSSSHDGNMANMPGMDHSGADSASQKTDDAALDLTATDYDFSFEKGAVYSGPTTVRLTNHGSEAHQVHIGRAPKGIGPDEFVHTYETKGEAAAFKLLSWIGGVAGVEPGQSSETTVDLAAGDYLMVCYLPTADGHSHVMKKMVARLHVADRPPSKDAPTVPSADQTVRLVDYRIELPQGFAGKGEVAITNEGKETHEFVLVKLDPGKTLADAAGWKPGSGQPAPFTFAGGAGSIEPGETEFVNMALTPGDYIATCQVMGPGGVPHIAMGMVTPFSVR